MDLKKIAKVVGTSALVVATGGLATPIVGVGMLGAVALSPVAVSSLGILLAMGPVGSMSELKKFKDENKKLREELRKSQLDNKTKQEVITKLILQLEEVKAQLKQERNKKKMKKKSKS